MLLFLANQFKNTPYASVGVVDYDFCPDFAGTDGF